jgi:WD40 repeat protein
MGRDGRFVAAVTGPDTFAVYDLIQQQQIATGEHARIAHVALSPDGRWVATATWGGRGVKLWDARSGQLVRDLLPEEGGVAILFSPDGRHLLVATERDYQFWQVGPWQVERRLRREGSGVPGQVAFSSDGRLLAATASRSTIQLIDPSTGNRLATFEPPDFTCLSSMTFSADGSQLVIAGNHNIQLWDLRAVRQQWAAMGLDWDLPP